MTVFLASLLTSIEQFVFLVLTQRRYTRVSIKAFNIYQLRHPRNRRRWRPKIRTRERDRQAAKKAAVYYGVNLSRNSGRVLCWNSATRIWSSSYSATTQSAWSTDTPLMTGKFGNNAVQYPAKEFLLLILLTFVHCRMFEQYVSFFAKYTSMISMPFLLGFYLTIIAGRWWQQYLTIPWPDRTM